MAQTQNVIVIPIGLINITKLSFHLNLSSFINLSSTKKILTHLRSFSEFKKINLDVQ